MEHFHDLLKRQLNKCFNASVSKVSDDWMSLLGQINDTYHQFDNDRRMFEHSSNLRSQELIQNKGDISDILSAFPDLYFVVDYSGNILQRNTVKFTDQRVLSQIVLNKKLQDVMSLEAGRLFEEAIQKVQKDNEMTKIEYWFSVQSVEKYYEARLLPFQEDKIFIVVRDITERKRTEETIKKTAAENLHLAQAINSVTDGIVITDCRILDHPIIYANPAFSKITGYAFEEIVGQNARFLQGPDTDPKVVKEISDALKMYKGVSVVILNYRKNGEAFWNEMDLSPIFSADGKPLYYVGIQQDVTIRRKTENEVKVMNVSLVNSERALRHMLFDFKKTHDELKGAQSQLVQSEKLAAIGQLAAGVAHEINNPVGFISNNMEVLQEYVGNYTKILKSVEDIKKHIEKGDMVESKSAVDALKKLEAEIDVEYMVNDVGKLLEHCIRGLERIRKIVLDLKTFAREDKAGVMERIQIEEAIDSILNIVQSELKYKAELTKDYGPTDPVRCNPQRLGQVFINLLVNAAQAMKERGKISIKTYQQDGYVCIDFSDTGQGIAPENIVKIFDPFFTTKPVGVGTGLGLSVSHEIIKNHGGELKVKSKLGEGTTFTVRLPLNEEINSLNKEQ